MRSPLLDTALVLALHSWTLSNPWAAVLATFVAERGIFLLPAALMVIWLLPGAGRWERRGAAVAGAVAFAMAGVLSAGLGLVVDRPRPFLALGISPLFAHSANSSFLSDHTLLGMALVGPLVRYRPRLGAGLILWTAVVGLARVAAAVHYPSDILGSALLATVPVALGVRLTPFLLGRFFRLWGTVDGGSPEPVKRTLGRPQTQRRVNVNGPARVLVVDDDRRLARLMETALQQAGYCVTTASSGVEALARLREEVFSLIVLDLTMPRLGGVGLLDKFIETVMQPAYTKGDHRKPNPVDAALRTRKCKLRKRGLTKAARHIKVLLHTLPSQDAHDPDFRRLHSVPDPDDWLIGFTGPREEAEAIKRQIGESRRNELTLTLSDQKTLMTHGRSQRAHFLGYEVKVIHNHTLHEPSTGRRTSNGVIGLLVPDAVVQAQKAAVTKRGKPVHPPARTQNSAYSIGAEDQQEFRGIAESDALAQYLTHSARFRHRKRSTRV